MKKTIFLMFIFAIPLFLSATALAGDTVSIKITLQPVNNDQPVIIPEQNVSTTNTTTQASAVMPTETPVPVEKTEQTNPQTPTEIVSFLTCFLFAFGRLLIK